MPDAYRSTNTGSFAEAKLAFLNHEDDILESYNNVNLNFISNHHIFYEYISIQLQALKKKFTTGFNETDKIFQEKKKVN